jgi:hypothetical protein
VKHEAPTGKKMDDALLANYPVNLHLAFENPEFQKIAKKRQYSNRIMSLT